MSFCVVSFNSPADFDLLAVRTGLRLFTPTFWNDNFRAYTNLAPGYSCGIWRDIDFGAWYDPTTGTVVVVNDSMKGHHGFGLSFGVGIQFKEKFSLGYTLQYETAGKTNATSPHSVSHSKVTYPNKRFFSKKFSFVWMLLQNLIYLQ